MRGPTFCDHCTQVCYRQGNCRFLFYLRCAKGRIRFQLFLRKNETLYGTALSRCALQIKMHANQLLSQYNTANVFRQEFAPFVLGLMRSANSPPAAARTREKEVFARTPRAPAKGCRPLHSCVLRERISPMGYNRATTESVEQTTRVGKGDK